MASYTQSVREILQFNKRPNESLLNPADVYAISNRCLFDSVPSNVISNEYKEAFYTGFALHFMNEEIGYETLPLWKIALNEKLYNSGSYINAIFENLDKQIFAEYNVKNIANEGTTSGSKSTDDTTSALKGITETSSDEANRQLTANVDTDTTTTDTDSEYTELSKTGSELRKKGGNDKLEKKGSESHGIFGKDTLEKQGDETHGKYGVDTVKMDGSELQYGSGEDVTTTHSKNSSGSSNYTNGLQVQMDTPMGALSNFGPTSLVGDNPDGNPPSTVSPITPDSNAEPVIDDTYGYGGTRGYNYAVGQDIYNYMSAAGETAQTQSNVDNGEDASVTMTSPSAKRVKTYGKDDEGDDDRIDTHTFKSGDNARYGYYIDSDGTYKLGTARKDITGHKSAGNDRYGWYVDENGDYNQTEDPRYDQTTYNSNEVLTYGNNGATENPSDPRIDATTRSASNENVVDGSVATSESETTDHSLSKLTSESDTSTAQGNEITSGAHTDDTNEVDHKIHWEMLYQSMPLLNKVWEQFDDLFMQIF